MTLADERVASLLGLLAVLIGLLGVGYSVLHALRDLQRQSFVTTGVLREIHANLAHVTNTLQELSRTFLEASLRDLRRLAGATQTALEGSLHDLRRITEAAEGALAPEEPLPASLLVGRIPARRPTPVLVIVRRGEVSLFELLREITDDVLWDRRVRERRERQEPSLSERRQRQRRRPPPRAWTALGFLIVPREGDRP